MRLYSENNEYKLYEGNMLDMLDVIAPNSIGSIVTDPPYELGFMGKTWDSSGIAFQPDTWYKCYQVLKPGGYLLAFGGSRTFHRIACAIEDAGFEIRDTIMWIYGCLSNDTEILTSNGWKKYGEIKENDEIYSLDLQKNVLIKNKCKHIFKWDYDGDMINLKNQNTNQLLTPNHHVIVKDVIRTRTKDITNYTKHDYWQYKDAWQIRSERTTLPLASVYDGSIEIGNLASELMGLILADGSYHKDTNAISLYQTSYNKETLKRIRYILGKLNLEYTEYERERAYDDNNLKDKLKEDKHGKIFIEHQFYLGEKCSWFVNKVKELCPNKKLNWNLLELSLSNKEFLIKGLCEGDGGKAPVKFGHDAFYQKDIHELEVFQVLLHMTNKQGWINEKHISCSIHLNPTTEIQGKHLANRIIKDYRGGYVWCIETEVGNFMAKRDGKIFITGNSGFPKSMSISKGIEEREKLGNAGTRNKRKIEQACDTEEYTLKQTNNGAMGEIIETTRKQYIPNTDLAKKWDGWGTCLKPSFEPIIVARKPLDGTCIDNVIKWGVGGINIDECRVPYGKETDNRIGTDAVNTSKCGFWQKDGNSGDIQMYKDNGRFPANTILTYNETNEQEVCSGFPTSKSTGGSMTMPDLRDVGKMQKEVSGINKLSFGQVSNASRKDYDYIAPNDEGSAARFFYNAEFTAKDEESLGRFPANTILTYDDSDEEEVCGGFPDTKSNIREPNGGKILNPESGWNNNSMVDKTIRGFNDSGSASRYFYCAKASKKDRDEGLEEFDEYIMPKTGAEKRLTVGGSKDISLPRKNIHPTVKPTDLLEYLVRLVTPDGETVLDPFNGSGSTGKAVMYENRERNKNYKYIGIELTPEYLPISRARIEYVCDPQNEITYEKVDEETNEVKKVSYREVSLF